VGDNTAALDINFSKRFSTNLISNIIYFILNLIIGLALAPFFLDTLGPSAYGLIPLATSVSSYVTLLISSVNSSVSRFLTIDLQKGDIDAANKTFNTALFGISPIANFRSEICIRISEPADIPFPEMFTTL
jgi:membrane protein EpsK